MENAQNSLGKDFSFLDNSIWIGCVKLSPLRRDYMSSAVNVWTKSPNILRITKRDFFEMNCLHSDQ